MYHFIIGLYLKLFLFVSNIEPMFVLSVSCDVCLFYYKYKCKFLKSFVNFCRFLKFFENIYEFLLNSCKNIYLCLLYSKYECKLFVEICKYFVNLFRKNC